MACFAAAPLQPDELAGIKRVVAARLPHAVDAAGLRLEGFLYLHALFIEKARRWPPLLDEKINRRRWSGIDE